MLITPDSDVVWNRYSVGSNLCSLPRTKQRRFEFSDQTLDKPPVQYECFRIPSPLPPQYEAMLINFANRIPSYPYIEIETDYNYQSIHNGRIFKTDDGVSICMCSPQSILPKDLKTRKYILSWVDLSQVCSKEVERLIEDNLIKKYYSLAKWNLQKNERNKKIDVLWNQKLKPVTYNYSTNGSKVFHYIGMGFPAPKNNEICMKIDSYSGNSWVSMNMLRKNFQTDCLYIFDCDNAASLKPGLVESIKEMKYSINGVPTVYAMFATAENQKIQIPETLPQNLFSCILIDPATVINSLYPETKNKEISTVTNLIDIFSESIALHSLDSVTFSQLFRRSNLASSLWRNFMLAQRLMKSFGLSVRSVPELPDCSEHPLWQQFEYALRCPRQEHIVSMYIDHFHRVPMPARDICAVLGTMMKVPEYYERILIAVSQFMRRSFKHLAYIIPFLDTAFIGQHRIAQQSVEGCRAWTAVVSATLLVDPGNKRHVQEDIEGRLAMDVIRDSRTDDVVRALMLSIFIVLSDAQTYYAGILGDESTIGETVKQIFGERNSGMTRLWLGIFVRALVNHTRAEPRMLSELRVPFLCALLMREADALTRAIAVMILAACANKRAPNFNAYLLRLAIPMAFDCSPIVRRAFAALAVHIAHLNRTPAERPKQMLTADLFICEDEFPEPPTRFLPELPAVLELLSKDPSESVREFAIIAADAKRAELKRSSEIVQCVYEEVQRLAHIALFFGPSNNSQEVKESQRYSDGVLAEGGLELLEELRIEEGEKVTAIAFDRSHCKVGYGTGSGRFVCGSDKWELGHGEVTAAAFVDGGYIAVGCSDGVVFTLRPGDSSTKRCFVFGVGVCSGRTFIAAAPGCSTVICNGSRDVISYDLAAGLPIAAVTLHAPMTACARVGTDIVVACAGGLVTLYDSDLKEKWSVRLSGEIDVKAVGPHKGSIFAASADRCFIINMEGEVKGSVEGSGSVVLHPTLPVGIVVGTEAKKEGAALVTPQLEIVEQLGAKSADACIIDADRPLAAIGVEGGVQLWRLPSTA